MTDADDDIQAPEPVYQTPDWEIPTHPLKRGLRNSKSLRNSLSLLNGAALTPPSRDPKGAAAKETPPPLTPSGASKPPLTTALRSRLDAVLPPQKTYLGRPRRFLLLYVILSLALLLLVVLPLAVGLGVGLSRRHSPVNLPLPDNGGGVFTGDLTYYDPGLGACGVVSGGGDAVCAVSHEVFDAAAKEEGVAANPNANPLCGRRIRVECGAAGACARGNRSVDVEVVDRCVRCSPTDLDLSPSAFERLAPRDSGRVVGSWAWLDWESCRSC
ncbi:hypothetical protein DL766_004831 [Monosporascus sp. MC13-8B]|uniref:RlpA-like protein double-psi beta-barrel domain-containing protein n=1 Tax=Monosporascus cannonballus TaxID=155416 RepID=A0ABY0HGU5_9PEZI|nr:hypothetical protein DL762_001268 [Monosporascus cannonballus]RYP30559.1 hypothetical protein DL766_004831 [Monosporascus sp. MC13-8B]